MIPLGILFFAVGLLFRGDIRDVFLILAGVFVLGGIVAIMIRESRFHNR